MSDPTPADLAARLKKEALEIFDGPETAQDVRDVIEWFASSIAATRAPPAPAVPGYAASSLAFTDEHVGYIKRYGGRCRDCADENGVCPSSGLPCGGADKAIRHVLGALAYGVNHGFVSRPVAAPHPSAQPAERVLAVRELGKEGEARFDAKLAAKPAEPKTLTNLQTWLTCKLIGNAATPTPETVKAWIAALAPLTGDEAPSFAQPVEPEPVERKGWPWPLPVQPDEPKERKPLMLECVEQAWFDMEHNSLLGHYDMFVAGVRFAERAHGIQEQPKESKE